jgi:hypothetical protein
MTGDHEVQDHHHAEMDEVDPQRLHGRQQHGNEDEQHDGAVEHRAEDEEADVDEDQEGEGRQVEAGDRCGRARRPSPRS